MKKIDLCGRRYARLEVIASAPSEQGQAVWLCRCDCGVEKLVRANDLRSGNTKSCGCYRREHSTEAGKRTVRHGGYVGNYPSAEYMAWQSMKQRCLNPNHKQWQRYGGRGIVICQSWLDRFEAFLADMGHRPSEQHSLDRIGNNGNYEPSNCRWATIHEQNRNNSGNHLITIDGVARCIVEWAEYAGVRRNTIDCRIKSGYSPEEAVRHYLRHAGRSATPS